VEHFAHAAVHLLGEAVLISCDAEPCCVDAAHHSQGAEPCFGDAKHVPRDRGTRS
jgi:hypothetical protein